MFEALVLFLVASRLARLPCSEPPVTSPPSLFRLVCEIPNIPHTVIDRFYAATAMSGFQCCYVGLPNILE